MQGEEGGGGRGKEEEEEDDNGEKMRKMILSSLPLLSVLFFSSSLSLTCKTRGGGSLKWKLFCRNASKRYGRPPLFFACRAARRRGKKKKNCGIFVCVANSMSELAVKVTRTFPPLKRNGDAAASSSFCRRWVHLCTQGGRTARPCSTHQHRTLFLLLRE